MGYALTERAKQLSSQTQIEPNLILTIDGYDIKFGVQIVELKVYVGQPGLEIGNFYIGGTFGDVDSRAYISLQGTSDTISQQLEPDKANASSTQSIKIRLVDFNGEVTRLISPGFELDDILYRDASVYLGFKGAAFPSDCIQLFSGKIQNVLAQSGNVELTVAHPDDALKAQIFTKAETKLVEPVDFNSAEIQDLTYYQRGDFVGTAQVRYLYSPFTGDVATVSVSGNLITVQIDTAATKASTIKKAIENSADANQVVTVKVTGTGSNIQAVQPITDLDSDLELTVEDASLFLKPLGTIFKTYVKIEDEILEYDNVDYDLNKIYLVSRASLDTFGAFHDVDSDVTSFYKLGDNTANSNAIDLSLRLYLSGADEFYLDDTFSCDFVDFGFGLPVSNGVYVRGVDLISFYNIQPGDRISLFGSSNPSNVVTDYLVDAIEYTRGGTLIQVDGASFVGETEVDIGIKTSCQWNTLPDGLGLKPNQVDIDRFQTIKTRFSSSIANYELYLKDTIDAKQFISEQIYLPSALYPVPRKGRVSIGFTSPPLYEQDSRLLDLDTVKRPTQIKLERTTNKRFYNAVVYKYNEDSLEDKPKNGRAILSNDSLNRIYSPNRPYTIYAKGLRPSPATTQLIERNAKSILARYQYAAEQVIAEPDFRTGFAVEIGDSVVFGGAEIQLSDSKTGERRFKERIFEVINKELNWKTGSIRLTLVDTNYQTGVRYGVFAPASIISAGSTASSLFIQDSFGVQGRERDKWDQYVGKKVRIHSQDFSDDATVTLQGFVQGNDYKLTVSPPLPFTPVAGYRMTVPEYSVLSTADQQLYKAINLFWDYSAEIVSASANDEFEVSALDADKFFVGTLVRVHNEDYSVDSGLDGIRVTAVSGTTITLANSLGFVPTAGLKIDLIGFAEDRGECYVWA